METSVRKLFERYEGMFMAGLRGDADLDQLGAIYTREFIAASPAGVMTGKNDAGLKEAMIEGYARYRAMGTSRMRMRGLRISPIDEHHCVAHVAWTATYVREGQPEVAIDFEVHYLIQKLASEPRIFGWVSGDEQALLKQHGIV